MINARSSQRKLWQILFCSLLAACMCLLNTGCAAIPSVFSAHTSTPTQVPSIFPTISTTPTIASTPVGFYNNQQLGFSLIYPQGWNVSKQSSSQVLITNAQDHMSLIVQLASNHQTVKKCLASASKLFKDSALGKLTSSKVGANEALVLADGTQALRESISTKFSKAGKLTMQAVCAQSKTRMYTFFIFGTGTSMTDHADVVDGIYKSIRLE
ncbi:MAG: hypothetical protein P4L50_06130 [Anaerolineaceae bacterium]|nr:hypothetical protein [Anaerolineaceae bacterium]